MVDASQLTQLASCLLDETTEKFMLIIRNVILHECTQLGGLLKFESRVSSIKNERIRCFLLIQLKLETRVLILETRHSIERNSPQLEHTAQRSECRKNRTLHFLKCSVRLKYLGT